MTFVTTLSSHIFRMSFLLQWPVAYFIGPMGNECWQKNIMRVRTAIFTTSYPHIQPRHHFSASVWICRLHSRYRSLLIPPLEFKPYSVHNLQKLPGQRHTCLEDKVNWPIVRGCMPHRQVVNVKQNYMQC